MRGVRIYAQGIKVALSGRMAYRGDFFISALLMCIMEFIVPFVTVLVYQSGAQFPGWSMAEVLLIQGLFIVSKGLASPTVLGMVYNTLSRVREGTLDILLLKPRSTLFMLIVMGFDSEDLGKLIGGIVLTTLALVQLPTPDFVSWIQCGALMVDSFLVFFSFAMIMSGILFHWVGNSRIFEIFDSLSTFGQYPLSIFSPALQAVLWMVIPIAMIGFFPAAALLGKPVPETLWAVAASGLFFAAGYVFFKRMLASYTSSGG